MISAPSGIGTGYTLRYIVAMFHLGKHPTQKPLGLLERIIAASTAEDDLVLDPFSGSATTGISAARLNRRYIGLEVESEFIDLSKKRYRHEYAEAGQSPFLQFERDTIASSNREEDPNHGLFAPKTDDV